jgi:hypothetical protein
MSWLPLQSTAFWAALALVFVGGTIAIGALRVRLEASKRGQGPDRGQPEHTAPAPPHEQRGEHGSLLALVLGSVTGTIGIGCIVLICLVAGFLAFVETTMNNCCSPSSSGGPP